MFLKITKTRTKRPAFVRPGEIIAVHRANMDAGAIADRQEATAVCMSSGDVFWVDELPEDIIRAMLLDIETVPERV